MKKGILIVFGNIDFGHPLSCDEKGDLYIDENRKEARINEIYFSRVVEEEIDPIKIAEDTMQVTGLTCYIIPQLYPGTIIWSK